MSGRPLVSGWRQDPGDWNSLGSVRINFASPFGVYMHDTPSKGLFNDEFRFDSSGCVRVQNIQLLITWLLRDNAGWNRSRVDGMFADMKRKGFREDRPLPVFLIGRNGDVFIGNQGNHRLAMAQILGIRIAGEILCRHKCSIAA